MINLLKNKNSGFIFTFFYISCCFPWLSFSILDNDSQPWYVIIGSIILITNKDIKINKTILYSLIFTLLGIFFSALINPNITSLLLRSTYNFLSFYIILIVSYSALVKGFNKYLLSKIFIFSNYIYILFSLIEIQFPSLIKFLSNWRTTPNRGLTSLTPEPGYFGMYLILSSLLIITLNNFNFKSNRFIHFLNIFSIVFLALSAMNTLYLFIFFVSFTALKIFQLKIYRYYFLLIPFLIIGGFIIVRIELLNDTRLFTLIEILINNPSSLLIGDLSIYRRISDFIYPLILSFQNFFIPQGLSGLIFQEYDIDSFFYSGSSKLMSWISDWIYSLGFFSIISLGILLKRLVNISNSFNEIFVIFCFSLMTIQSIPVSSPFVPIFISIFLTQKFSISYESNANESNDLLIDP